MNGAQSSRQSRKAASKGRTPSSTAPGSRPRRGVGRETPPASGSGLLFEYKGDTYPSYLKRGNACQFIAPVALQFCQGWGVDVGCGDWPLPGSIPVDKRTKWQATYLPRGLDYVFSSHFLEHAIDPVACLEHWLTRLKPGGCCLVYLPHPAQKYWRPQHCKKHLHLFWPKDFATMMQDLGYVNVLHGERDLAWSFAVVGWKP